MKCMLPGCLAAYANREILNKFLLIFKTLYQLPKLWILNKIQ